VVGDDAGQVVFEGGLRLGWEVAVEVGVLARGMGAVVVDAEPVALGGAEQVEAGSGLVVPTRVQGKTLEGRARRSASRIAVGTS